MKLYRFSPIDSKEGLLNAIDYVAAECTWLYFNEVSEVPEIKSLTIFAHFDKEFTYLKSELAKLGETHNEHNGPRIKLSQPIKVASGELNVNGRVKPITQTIEYLRIRQPDPYRMQAGCCDYVEDDYWRFKDLDAGSARCIKRENYEMLEFYSPHRDVLGYVVSPYHTLA
jgi:hypothetical protein